MHHNTVTMQRSYTIRACELNISSKIVLAHMHPSVSFDSMVQNHNNDGSQDMLDEQSDAQLIKRYLSNKDEQVFATLLQRHYDATYHRFLKHLRNADDAADLSQQLWLRVVNNLGSYKDDGKFPSFLMRIATNLLTDFWRRKGVRDRAIYEPSTAEEQEIIEHNATVDSGQLDSALATAEEINHLTTALIPQLPTDQRLTFLLKHESEFWEKNQPLDWQTLAKLNAISAESAHRKFEKYRDNLMKAFNGTDTEELETQDMLLFLIWTQAQRLDKKQEFTWDYFSQLLGVSANTLKTRYRAALKSLTRGLDEFNSNEH